ncbi:MAG: GNAT family N-acetyltransferase [Dysosmobacter welbionis]
MHIRTASLADAAALAAVEAACFPPAEAATAAEITDRLAYYADHFWLLEEDDGTLVSFVDGMVTDESKLRDEMYETAALHNENGTRQMIFGVNTLPAYRCRGCAGAVLERVIADARAQEDAAASSPGDKLVLLRKIRLCERGRLQSPTAAWYGMTCA